MTRPNVEEIRAKAIDQLTGTGETAMDARVPALCDWVLELEATVREACRELPCGAHPRLESLGQPARFRGGCGKPVIAPEAIVCADCMAWFCSRDCARNHFATHDGATA